MQRSMECLKGGSMKCEMECECSLAECSTKRRSQKWTAWWQKTPVHERMVCGRAHWQKGGRWTANRATPLTKWAQERRMADAWR
jgi:hypothetical protein